MALYPDGRSNSSGPPGSVLRFKGAEPAKLSKLVHFVKGVRKPLMSWHRLTIKPRSDRTVLRTENNLLTISCLIAYITKAGRGTRHKQSSREIIGNHKGFWLHSEDEMLLQRYLMRERSRDAFRRTTKSCIEEGSWQTLFYTRSNFLKYYDLRLRQHLCKPHSASGWGSPDILLKGSNERC